MNIPENVSEIIKQINENGYEAYLVGGCVRDMLMGKAPSDWDITTSASPDIIKSIFKHTFDTGIAHGTVTVVMDRENYEITTYRIDGEYKDSRRPHEVFFTDDLRLDLMRRDFTVNAIAYHPKHGYKDYYGGMKDIERKIIRGVGDPDARFKEDALRMLRAIRFSCQLGFDIDQDTFSALILNKNSIKNISVERIKVELIKTLASKYTENLAFFDKCNILKFMIPCGNEIFNGCSELIKRLNRLEKKTPAALMSIFLCDEDMVTAERIMLYLKCDNKLIKDVKTTKPYIYGDIPPSKPFIKKIISAMDKDLFYLLMDIRQAAGMDVCNITSLADSIFEINEPIYIKDLNINGDLLINNLGVKGKIIGHILKYLQTIVWENPYMNNEGELIALSKDFLKSAKP